MGDDQFTAMIANVRFDAETPDKRTMESGTGVAIFGCFPVPSMSQYVDQPTCLAPLWLAW
jgi:hypothetical protein